jgi:type II secretory pathway predicted ATPase ExeA
VSSDFHLKALGRDEVGDYIGFRLSAVGARQHLFTDEACRLIAEASHGIPRMINILCDTALVYGYSSGARLVNRRLMEEVIADKRNFGIFPIGTEAVS